MKRGLASADPAEQQADELGEQIGDDINGMGSVGHGALPRSVQQVAERHLGVSIEGTQLEAGSSGQKKADDESALAVTEGKQIAFGGGNLSTSTEDGRALLGHELVHVGQQVGRSPKRQRQGKAPEPPRTQKPVGLPEDPKAVTLEYVRGLVTKGDLGGALYVIRGRSMSQMLSWLDGIAKDLGAGGQAAFKSAASGAGGWRLQIAVGLAYFPSQVSPDDWLAFSQMNPATREVILDYAKAKGLKPPCALALPQFCDSFEEWIGTFPPPQPNPQRETFSGPPRETITLALPPELAAIVRGSLGLKADCADVALILREYYLRAKREVQQLTATRALGTGTKTEMLACMSELGSGLFHQEIAPVDYYKSGGQNITELDGLLAAGLKPGDVFVWKALTSGGAFAGHVQIVRSIVRIPGQAPRIVFVQGTQTSEDLPKGEVQYEHSESPGLSRLGQGFYGAGPWRGPR